MEWFSPIFNTVATYETIVIRVAISTPLVRIFYCLVHHTPQPHIIIIYCFNILLRVTAIRILHYSTLIYNTLTLLGSVHAFFTHNKIFWSTYRSPTHILLQLYVRTPLFTPEHIPLRYFNSFLKIYAFDETLVLSVCLFTSTVTYVLDPPKSKTMTAFALSSTTPCRHHWQRSLSPTLPATLLSRRPIDFFS